MSGRGSIVWLDDGIPSELRSTAPWVAWHYVDRDGRATKMPLCARSGGAASATDPATWTDYATAASYARVHGCGVGIMLGDGLAGVDLDDCVGDRGELEPWARGIIVELDSYTETSPSGRGVHVLVRGTLLGTRRRCGKIEMYDRARYFCVTGRPLSWTRCTIEERTRALAALHQRIFAPVVETGVVRPQTRRPVGLCASDSEIVERAGRARNGARFLQLWRGDASGYASPSEADLALCSVLAWYTDDADQIARLVSQSGLARQKWGRPDYRARTIATALASVGARRVVGSERVAHADALIVRELGL